MLNNFNKTPPKRATIFNALCSIFSKNLDIIEVNINESSEIDDTDNTRAIIVSIIRIEYINIPPAMNVSCWFDRDKKKLIVDSVSIFDVEDKSKKCLHITIINGTKQIISKYLITLRISFLKFKYISKEHQHNKHVRILIMYVRLNDILKEFRIKNRPIKIKEENLKNFTKFLISFIYSIQYQRFKKSADDN